MDALRKLKNTYVYKELINNFILIAIYVALGLLTINNIYFIILFLLYNYYIFKKSINIFLISIIFICIICLHLSILKGNNHLEIKGVCTVYDVEIEETYQKIIIKKGKEKAIIYDFDMHKIIPGNKVKMIVQEREIYGERIEGGFNYQKYLKNNNINNVYILKDLEIVNNKYNLNYGKYLINSYFDKNFDKESRSFLKALILGNKSDFDENLIESIKTNGIMHLFAISGLHVGIVIIIFKKLLEILKIQNNDIYICLFLFLYMFITSFSPSIVRAVLMFYLLVLNKKLFLGFSSLDIVSIIFLILILYNPLYMFNNGFVLSFIVTFLIVLLSPLLKNKSFIIQSLIISSLSNIITLPIIINMNNKINLLSPFLNVFFIFLVSTIILPITFVVAFLPFMNSVYIYIIRLFSHISYLASNYLSINIVVASMSKLSIFLFYSLLILFILFYNLPRIRRINICLLVLFLFIISFFSPIHFKNEITFMDLDDGEATFIHSYSDNCSALIDTGSGKNNEVSSYLKRKGIKRIDYLILTHNHDDHNGEALTILKEIKVNKIVVSAYDNSDFSNFKKTIKVKANDKITCGKITFNVLHPDKNYQDMNDNSLILHTKIGKHYFLFLGDANREVEEKLMVLNLKVDVLKVSHHGSKTSSSPLFIESILPKYAIIMSGRVKRFGFPHQETINTFTRYGVNIFRTDIDYSIVYSFNKKKGTFRKLNPQS